MDQDRRFQHQHQQPYGQPYGYDQYPQQGASSRRGGLLDRIMGVALSPLRSPVIATATLLLAGAAFAGVIFMSYPEQQDEASVPLVQADAAPFKVAPDDTAGADIPFRDNTVFTAMTGENGIVPEAAPVENLLEMEEPVDDRLEAFAEEAEEVLMAAQAESKDYGAQEPGADDQPSSTVLASIPGAEDIQPVAVQKIEQTVEIIPPQIPPEVQASSERPKIIHKPGSSPETLDFVRSVLEQKDGKAPNLLAGEVASSAEADQGTQASAVEPAAGAAPVAASAIAPGDYFVQLASVTSRSGADSEWTKLQKSFSAQLQNASYRVQEADLGERGVYYRIQAGPMSANSICEAIKARKPGGCLVVQ